MKDWRRTLLRIDSVLQDAWRVIQKGEAGIALFVDDNRRLLRTITDGDIRGALIKHLGMDCLVEKVMNDSPETALNSDTPDLIMSKMKSRNLLHIPIVDENKILIGLKTIQHLTYAKRYDNPVFLMAGGFGTRLLPLTKETPKPLLDVGNRPILETIIVRLAISLFYYFYFSTHYISVII